ncbi:MAG: signal peptidase I [Bifidobacteriaceae bacterium]|nr:signal peptidase I [Bifidobacteriaceae bacterium]
MDHEDKAPPARFTGGWVARAAKEIAFVALAAVVLSFVLKTFLVQSFFIPSPSMEDTLLIDDRVMVSKLAPTPFGVHRGDVVVFTDPGGWLSGPALPAQTGVGAWINGAFQAIGLAPSTADNFLIKRVIGTGGDHIECEVGDVDTNANGLMDGVISVNGVALDEVGYLKPGEVACEAELDVTVPEGALWMMGDNRSHSGDSRAHQDDEDGGSVKLGNVVGIAKIRTWPLNRLALLRNPGHVFADVPAAEGR